MCFFVVKERDYFILVFLTLKSSQFERLDRETMKLSNEEKTRIRTIRGQLDHAFKNYKKHITFDVFLNLLKIYK
jgi:hypothetical protein